TAIDLSDKEVNESGEEPSDDDKQDDVLRLLRGGDDEEEWNLLQFADMRAGTGCTLFLAVIILSQRGTPSGACTIQHGASDAMC
ncbi:hypothetical protein Tco_0399009, partial [Tanacetum coccineum]